MVKRLIAYFSSLLLPIAGYVFPIWLLQKDFCFNSTTLRFLISPLVAALLLAVVIFSKWGRKWVKVLLSIGILILFVFFYLCNFMFGTFAYLDCYEQEQVQEPYTTVRESWECSWLMNPATAEVSLNPTAIASYLASAPVAFIMIHFYNGEPGEGNRYINYLAYPVILLATGLLAKFAI
jgi:hypothetical protein